MPISVPGTGKLARQSGFSLLEVLIVLLIIGVASTAVSISAFSDTDARTLRRDAVHLTQLFAVAQAEARKGSSAVIWVYDSEGYGFARAPRNLFQPTGMTRQTDPGLAESFDETGSLRRRSWTSDNALEIRLEPSTANMFNPEWISGPLAVELHDGQNKVRIVRSGNGQYQVLP
jgi:general secretion pathway protein H